MSNKALIWKCHLQSFCIIFNSLVKYFLKDKSRTIRQSGKGANPNFSRRFFIGLFASPVAGIALCNFECLSFMDVTARFSSNGRIKQHCTLYRKSRGMFNDPVMHSSLTTDQMKVLTQTHTHTPI